jgi:hypothetical protein
MTADFCASGALDPAHQEDRMSHQQSFDFDGEEEASRTVEKRATEKEINKKLRYMQSLPDDDPNKDVLANEILQWILTR